jgi:hypothetical protein
MPRASKTIGKRRGRKKPTGAVPLVALAALSIGLLHQLTARLSSPAAAIAIRPVRPSLVASQRVRVTLWFHTSMWVPASSSRVTRGAPQNMPMIAGRASRTRAPTR